MTSDMRHVAHALMRSLTATYGCLDAAAETINARWPERHVEKGLLSRKMRGSCDWTLADVIALEDAAQQYPVTRALARRTEDPELPRVDTCLLAQSGSVARETGEAIEAILAAQRSSDVSDYARAIAEVDEAMEALRKMRVALEGA